MMWATVLYVTGGRKARLLAASASILPYNTGETVGFLLQGSL